MFCTPPNGDCVSSVKLWQALRDVDTDACKSRVFLALFGVETVQQVESNQTWVLLQRLRHWGGASLSCDAAAA